MSPSYWQPRPIRRMMTAVALHLTVAFTCGCPGPEFTAADPELALPSDGGPDDADNAPLPRDAAAHDAEPAEAGARPDAARPPEEAGVHLEAGAVDAADAGPPDALSVCRSSCKGCCLYTGECVSGTEDDACGTRAINVMCLNCYALGGRCSITQQCSNDPMDNYPDAAPWSPSALPVECNAQSCPDGCCHPGNQCFRPTRSSCGLGGVACFNCAISDQVCATDGSGSCAPFMAP